MPEPTPLEEYRRKRDFSVTPEPAGRPDAATGRTYVIQKHDASRLHYDFRLELDGVLKSWAVPKGPSLDPSQKRLAVHVEDHPVSYAEFEGTIPTGQYGGGTVLVWDHGTWEPEGDPAEGYRRGRLRFRLHGRKLTGTWSLVRMHGRTDGGDNWLLIKGQDEAARPLEEYDILVAQPDSAKSGRALEAVAASPAEVYGQAPAQPDPARLPGARRGDPPAQLKPQMCTLVRSAPAGDDWLHEVKYDGYRIVCRLCDGRATLLTRNGNDWTERFAAITEAAERLGVRDAVLDGEVVAVADGGVSDFQTLQNSMQAGGGVTLAYYAFDLPFYDGWDLTRTRLEARKSLLAAVLRDAPAPLRFSDHQRGHGAKVFKEACARNLEGVVSKRADSPYVCDRTASWVKAKCHRRQEFVVGGFTDPKGARVGLGALLLGYHDADGRLVYCGKVGTGFTEEVLIPLARRLRGMAQATAPFVHPPYGGGAEGVHWVPPVLVAEIEFTEFTDDGLLRHPSFQGLREDKPSGQVVREEPQPAPADPPPPTARAADRIGGVGLTHPDRVLYPEVGLTKGELAVYYERVAEFMLPHLAGRPLTLIRCPQGSAKKCFIQRHYNDGLPAGLHPVPVPEGDATVQFVALDDLTGLIGLVQIGVLEIHPWGSREDDLERPDRLIFDLDPAENVPWATVVDAARAVRAKLAGAGLESFVKTSGGKGLHVVAPLTPAAGWDLATDFARAVAESLVADAPEAYLATMSKAKRAGKVFIDYLRNARSASAVAPWSTRARPGAPISAPLAWDDLAELTSATAFGVANAGQYLATRDGDPWARFAAAARPLTEAMVQALTG